MLLCIFSLSYTYHYTNEICITSSHPLTNFDRILDLIKMHFFTLSFRSVSSQLNFAHAKAAVLSSCAKFWYEQISLFCATVMKIFIEFDIPYKYH